jgi:hypothetical protein
MLMINRQFQVRTLQSGAVRLATMQAEAVGSMQKIASFLIVLAAPT